MTKPSRIEDELHQVGAMLAQTRGAIAAGRLIDLSSLEEKVQSLCEGIGRLPRAQAQAHKPALIALIDELGTLTEAIKAGLEALGDELGDSNRRKGALNAYGKRAGAR